MTINYTTLLGLAKPVTGTETGQWGDVVNDEITSLLEDAVANAATFSVTSGNVTLTTTNGASNQARMSTLIITGSPGTTRNVVAPSQAKIYQVINQSDGAVVIKGSATTGVTIAAGATGTVVWNGSDFVEINSTSSGRIIKGNVQITGNLQVDGNTTLGDASADTVTVNGTITSNLIFTDNTYDIGASGATRPRSLYLANTATIGSATVGTNKLAVGGNVLLSSASPLLTFNDTISGSTNHYFESSGSTGDNFKIRIYNTLYLNTRQSTGTYYDRMTIDATGGVTFLNTGTTDGQSSLSINSTQAILYRNLLFSADNTYDIGASGATRPRNLYLAGTAGAVTAGLSTGTTQTYLKTQHSLNSVEFGIFANGKGYASSNGAYDFQIFRNTGSVASFTATGIQLDQTNSGIFSGSNSSSVTFSAGTALGTSSVGSAVCLFPSGDATFGSDVHFLTGSGGSSKKFVWWNYSGSFNRLATLDSSGQLCLGSGGATATKLDVYASSNTTGVSAAIFRNLSGSNALVINVPGTATQGGTQVLDVGADASGLSATFVGKVIVGPTTSPTELLNVYSTAGTAAKIDINASSSGQAGVTLRAGSGTTYRASRIDFYQTPVSSATPRWTFINDYDQNNTNDMRLYSGAAGLPVQTWKGDGTTSVYNTLGVGNAAGSTSGAGITFPATQSASSNANTLDDYEEGSWTPILQTENGNMSVSYAVQEGSYTKIGNFVHARGYLLVTAISSQGTGGVVINGLPFTQNEQVNFNFSDGAIMGNYWGTTTRMQIYGYCTGGKMFFRGNGPGGTYRSLTTGSVNADYMLFTVTYQTS